MAQSRCCSANTTAPARTNTTKVASARFTQNPPGAPLFAGVLAGGAGREQRAVEHSELVAEILGEHVFDFFLRNKRQEWDGYRRQVTPYELATYLPVL